MATMASQRSSHIVNLTDRVISGRKAGKYYCNEAAVTLMVILRCMYEMSSKASFRLSDGS